MALLDGLGLFLFTELGPSLFNVGDGATCILKTWLICQISWIILIVIYNFLSYKIHLVPNISSCKEALWTNDITSCQRFVKTFFHVS